MEVTKRRQAQQASTNASEQGRASTVIDMLSVSEFILFEKYFSSSKGRIS